MTRNLQKIEWDFSFTSAITTLLILTYITQIVRLKFGKLRKRNRLTLMIHISFLLDLTALQIRTVAEILMVMYNTPGQYLISYMLNTFATEFFLIAVLIQILEWNLIASMVKFQASRTQAELGVEKSDFNLQERRMARFNMVLICTFSLFISAKIGLALVVYI